MLKYRPYDFDLAYSMNLTKKFRKIRDIFEYVVNREHEIEYIYDEEDEDYCDELDDVEYIVKYPYRIEDLYLCPIVFDDSYINWGFSRYILSDYRYGERLDEPVILGVVCPYDESFLSKLKDKIFGNYSALYYPQELYAYREYERYKQILDSRKG